MKNQISNLTKKIKDLSDKKKKAIKKQRQEDITKFENQIKENKTTLDEIQSQLNQTDQLIKDKENFEQKEKEYLDKIASLQKEIKNNNDLNAKIKRQLDDKTINLDKKKKVREDKKNTLNQKQNDLNKKVKEIEKESSKHKDSSSSTSLSKVLQSDQKKTNNKKAKGFSQVLGGDKKEKKEKVKEKITLPDEILP